MTPPVVKWSGDGDYYCRTCKVSFRTVEAKLAHMNQQRRAGKLGHITCQICAEGFYSEEAMFGHLREAHPQSQNLHCPACNSGPFAKLFQLIAHIEKGNCQRLDAEALDRLREKKMEFTKGLKQLTNEPIKHDFSVYLPSHAYTRARNAFSEEQKRKFADASPPTWDAPAPFHKSGCQWPAITPPQDNSPPANNAQFDRLPANFESLKISSMAHMSKSPMSSDEDIPNIMDAEEPGPNTPVLQPQQPQQPSLPPHLAASQKAKLPPHLAASGKKRLPPHLAASQKQDPPLHLAVSQMQRLPPHLAASQTQRLPPHLAASQKQSLPPHLAAQQPAGDLRPSPWGQKIDENRKPTGSTQSTESPWAQKTTGPPQPPRSEQRVQSPWAQTPSSPQQQAATQTPTSSLSATWGQKLFPNAPPAQRPTTQQLDAAYRLSERQRHRLLNPDDPGHPDFNPAKYCSPYTGKFVCPKLGCGKCVKSAAGLVAHLKSEAHSTQLYTCPRCLGRYKSLTAFTAHLESESTRCNVRDARDFDALIDQLTSGLVDVAVNRHNDGTNKFEVNTTAENKARNLGRDPTYEDRERAKVTAKNSSWDDIKPLKVEGW